MKKVVFDSSTLITLFKMESGFEFVRDALLRIANEESEGFISALTVGEIYYLIARESNSKNGEAAINALKQMPIHIIDLDLKMCLEAASIQTKYSLSSVQAHAVTLSINKRATLLTANKEFEKIVNEFNFKVKSIR